MVLGVELRNKFREETVRLSKDKFVSPTLFSFIQKDFKELSPNVKVDEKDSLRFSLFKPIMAEEKHCLSNSVFLSLTVKSKIIETVFFKSPHTNLHLAINLERNASYDLVILMPDNINNIPSNSVIVESFLGGGASLKLTVISNKGSILNRFYSECNKNSRFESSSFSLSGGCVKSKIFLFDESSCSVNNSFFSSNNNYSESGVVIHEGKNSSSLINSKGFLLNGSSDVRGLIKINKDAFNAQGFQEFDVLIEGDSHSISVPDLEILNNEVKCSHGSTASRIRDEDLFYFESRGIDKSTARNMLIKGFLLSVFNNEDVKKIVSDLLSEVVFS